MLRPMTNKQQILDTVLLLALPASGKSEVRRYMAQLSPKECRDDFHMGPTLQLDDFPYVHMMRRIDEELAKIGRPRIFFKSPDKPFMNPRDWGTLIHLINEDHADLLSHRNCGEKSAAALLMKRIDQAGAKADIAPRLSHFDQVTLNTLGSALEREAREMLDEKNTLCKQDLAGKTLVIEFARGGAHGSNMPLAAPFGYQYSLAALSPAILEKARILYVWVTPEESRRKNHERTDPNDPGSILHHGVPIDVMMNDYGCDDMEWLEANAKKCCCVTIEASGRAWNIPIARFDNRVDKTSFIRKDRKDWQPNEVKAVHQGLQQALEKLASFEG